LCVNRAKVAVENQGLALLPGQTGKIFLLQAGVPVAASRVSEEARAALDQSKAAMKNGDTTGCMKHMAEAHKAMGL
jgi:hypothetical protein